MPSKRVRPPLARAHPHEPVDRRAPHLAVADLPGLRGGRGSRRSHDRPARRPRAPRRAPLGRKSVVYSAPRYTSVLPRSASEATNLGDRHPSVSDHGSREPGCSGGPGVKGFPHATGDDRTRPDGRQHGAPAGARRARVRRLRRRRARRWRRSPAKGSRGAADARASSSAKLDPPRHVWIMVPAAFVDSTDRRARRRCSSAATRSSTAATRGTATTSTAPARWPRTTASTTSTSARAAACTASSAGYCLMIGGPDEAVGAAGADLRRPRARRRRGRADAHAGRAGASRSRPSAAGCTAARAAPATS